MLLGFEPQYYSLQYNGSGRHRQEGRPPEHEISRLHFSRRDILNAILLFGILLCRDGGLALLGGGLTGRGLCGFRVGSLRRDAVHPAAYGGQIHAQGVVPAVHAAIGGVQVSGAAAVRAVPAGSLAVQQLIGGAGILEVERELLWAVFWVFITQRMVWPAPFRSQAYTPSSRLSQAIHSKQFGLYSPS